MSDFTVNLIEGLSDYDPKTIQRLVALPVNDFTDTIFKSAQITFSLMYLLDEHRKSGIGTDRIHDAIRKTDSLVIAAQEEHSILDPQIVAGFAAGNLHRIRTRKIRHEILGQYLAA